MKCVKNSKNKIIRVRDERAAMLVDEGDYSYCSKEEYKKSKKPPKGV